MTPNVSSNKVILCLTSTTMSTIIDYVMVLPLYTAADNE